MTVCDPEVGRGELADAFARCQTAVDRMAAWERGMCIKRARIFQELASYPLWPGPPVLGTPARVDSDEGMLGHYTQLWDVFSIISEAVEVYANAHRHDSNRTVRVDLHRDRGASILSHLRERRLSDLYDALSNGDLRSVLGRRHNEELAGYADSAYTMPMVLVACVAWRAADGFVATVPTTVIMRR